MHQVCVNFYLKWHVLSFFFSCFPTDLIATVSGYIRDLKTTRCSCFNLS